VLDEKQRCHSLHSTIRHVTTFSGTCYWKPDVPLKRACADGFSSVRFHATIIITQHMQITLSDLRESLSLRETNERTTDLNKFICCYIKINSSSVFADSSSGIELFLNLLRRSQLESRRNSRSDRHSLIKLLHYQPPVLLH